MSQRTILTSKNGRKLVYSLNKWQPLWRLAYKAVKFSDEDWEKGILREGGQIDQSTALGIAQGIKTILQENGWKVVALWVCDQYFSGRELSERNVNDFVEFCRSSGGFAIGGFE